MQSVGPLKLLHLHLKKGRRTVRVSDYVPLSADLHPDSSKVIDPFVGANAEKEKRYLDV